jgi:uncharacterized protein YbbC (DUF1343 family)
MKRLKIAILLSATLIFTQCSKKIILPTPPSTHIEMPTPKPIIVGAEQLTILLPKLQEQPVALVVNNTALVGKTHLADTLKSRGINIKKIFAPEHGFRGTADAGEHVKDGIDKKTGFPIISLYGNKKKPTREQLADVNIVIFDIQDVGVRFYTYISTLHYIMEACAEHGKKLIIVDRPNPNGSYVDGPVLQPEHKSFLGMHPIPLVHGLTVGELAQMINGEGWLDNGKKCTIEIIPVKNWRHADFYSLPEKPSPNLPNDQSIKLYPSLGLFEGTVMSVGRGTPSPFQIVGHPDIKTLPFQFTPVSIEGMAKNPLHENKICYGLDLRNIPLQPKLSLSYLIQMYALFPDKEKFFNKNSFDKHVGTSALRQQIREGLSEEAIRQTWQKDLEVYKAIRSKYLLYP